MGRDGQETNLRFLGLRMYLLRYPDQAWLLRRLNLQNERFCVSQRDFRENFQGGFILMKASFFFLTVENVSYCLINYLYLLKVFKIKIELRYVPSSHSSLQYFLCAPVSHYISRLWFPSLLLLEVTLLLPSILDLPTFCLLLENKKASME